MTGRGPNLGLNGDVGCWALTFFAGLFEVINCGCVKFRQVVNSTVEPRYCEHLKNIFYYPAS